MNNTPEKTNSNPVFKPNTNPTSSTNPAATQATGAASSNFRRGGPNDRPRFDRNSPASRLRNGKKRETNRRTEVPDEFESQVIQVRRISKTVSGGKIMRFSALIVSGDKKGKVGYGLGKGRDFQEAVAKATRQAKNSIIKLDISDDLSIKFPSQFKYKAVKLFLKPAQSGTGLIAGSYLRPVLQLSGIQNIYSKIIGSNNKVVGVRAIIEALKASYTV